MNPTPPPHSEEAIFTRALALPAAERTAFLDRECAALKACEPTAWKNAGYVDSLAAAYAESGDFERAIETQQQTMQAGQLSESKRAGYETRLALYRERRPYRLPVR